MTIVSQDKTEIINYDNVFSLYVDTWSSEEFATEPDCWCIRAEKAQDNLIYAFLGEYKTEERAREVLRELINRIVLTERFEATFILEKQDNMVIDMYDNDRPLFVYEMPEE